MKIRALGSCLLAASLFILGARPAMAAEGDLTASVNYDLVYHIQSDNSMVGLHLDVAKELANLGVVGEIGFNHFEFGSLTGFLVGVRKTLSHATGAPNTFFVQGLVGGTHCCGEMDLSIQPGFGINHALAGNAKRAIRGQFDIRYIKFEGDSETDPRLSIGLIFDLSGN